MNLTCALVLQVRDGRLPVFQIPELHDRINAKVFEEHAKDDEPLVIVGKYAPDELDFLGHLVHATLRLFLRPATSFTANLPSFLGHDDSPELWRTAGGTSGYGRLSKSFNLA
jgi:hypothetical protein